MTLLRELRQLSPARPLTIGEGLRVAELQAARLLEFAEIAVPPVPLTILTLLPRVQLRQLTPLPVSGLCRWSNGVWLIVTNAAEPATRQRFSAVHEAKHIIDANRPDTYPRVGSVTTTDRAEQICDHFAACVLMPRTWVKRSYCNGIQELTEISQLFEVSRMAMQTRLIALGLIPAPARCDRAGAAA